MLASASRNVVVSGRGRRRKRGRSLPLSYVGVRRRANGLWDQRGCMRATVVTAALPATLCEAATAPQRRSAGSRRSSARHLGSSRSALRENRTSASLKRVRRIMAEECAWEGGTEKCDERGRKALTEPHPHAIAHRCLPVLPRAPEPPHVALLADAAPLPVPLLYGLPPRPVVRVRNMR